MEFQLRREEEPESDRESELQRLIGPRNLSDDNLVEASNVERSAADKDKILSEQKAMHLEPSNNSEPAFKESADGNQSLLDKLCAQEQALKEKVIDKVKGSHDEVLRKLEVETAIDRVDRRKLSSFEHIRIEQDIKNTVRDKISEFYELVKQHGSNSVQVREFWAANSHLDNFKDKASIVLLEQTGSAKALMDDARMLRVEREYKKDKDEPYDQAIASLVNQVKLGNEVMIDRYRIRNFIAEGGLFFVLEAQHGELDNKPLALKLVKRLSDIPKLQRHAQVLNLLSHPSIPSIVDVNSKDDIPYVVEDYITGDSLKKIIEKNSAQNSHLNEYDSIEMMRQLLSAVAHIHERGIVHGDVSPYNVVALGSAVKLTDFNISRGLEGAVKEDFNHTLTTQVDDDSVGFTLDYSAPEQRNREQLDKRSDLYSLAVTFFEMLTNKIQRGSVFDPKTLNSKLAHDYSEFFEKALQYYPKDRFQSADEMLCELEKIVKVNRFENLFSGAYILYADNKKICKLYPSKREMISEAIYFADDNQIIRDFALMPDNTLYLLIQEKERPDELNSTYVVLKSDIDFSKVSEEFRQSYPSHLNKIMVKGKDVYAFSEGDSYWKKGWYKYSKPNGSFEVGTFSVTKDIQIFSPNGSYKYFISGIENEGRKMLVLPTFHKASDTPLAVINDVICADWVYPVEPKETKRQKGKSWLDMSVREMWNSIFGK